MTNKTEILNKLTDAKLIDVVKNYRQYGYDDTLRNAAISILNERGLTVDDLIFGGNFTNTQYDNATEYYQSYNQNSQRAFILYSLSLASIIVLPWITMPSDAIAKTLVIVNIILNISFIVFLIKAYISHSEFYTAMGKKLAKGDQLIFFIVGIPFYILMYFFYRSQMKEEMKAIQ
ncbi:hypothetical protein CJD36_013105 [Flavipsychrobacter stenotrophus]|uniref:Uncharacterized protein n=1 Tax=Flavipsychrobacter stenotrophus TaxID=2077091 RepID=A0A2S7SVH5_9BACT|nr:hypothetical protein [Flavipsychrobacter stenotrophus]PQJ10903.1 hypothetical protein CJD36_013105 [Flavipsychrobacter stenotrophus]